MSKSRPTDHGQQQPRRPGEPVQITAELLKRIAIFGALRDDTLEFLLNEGAWVEVAEGETFFEEFTPGTSLYVLESGIVEVTKQRGEACLTLCNLGPGDVFGEMALLAVMPRSASVRAAEPCRALELTNRDLFKLYSKDVEQFAVLIMNVGREVARRLWETNERLFHRPDLSD